MLVMEALRVVAERHGWPVSCTKTLRALVSGKHNWAIVGPDGKNWLSPGVAPRKRKVSNHSLRCYQGG